MSGREAAGEEGGPSRRRWLVLPALLAGAGGLVWRLAWASRQDVFSDDAYYYLVVAEKLVETGRFTFDGVAPASGFHPLWMGLQALLLAAVPGLDTPGRVYGAVVVLSALILGALLVAVGVAAWRALGARRHEDFWIALLVALAAAYQPALLATAFQGMESTLTLPLLVAFAVLLRRGSHRGAGAVGALLVLARLDTLVFVLLPVAAWYHLSAAGGREPPWRRLRPGAELLAPGVAAALLWMGASQLLFGDPMPVSGTLKSTFPVPNLQWHQWVGAEAGAASLARSKVVWSLLLAGTGAAALPFARRSPPALRRLGGGLALAALSVLLSFLLFQRWTKPVPAWYLALPFLAAALAAALGLAGALRPRARDAAAALLLGALALLGLRAAGGATRYALTHPGFQLREGELVAFMRSSERDLWAGTDVGAVAFWSGEPVVNLDGLVNSRAYQDRLERGELAAYLRERGVEGLLVSVWSGPQALPEPMYQARIAPDAHAGRYDTLPFWVHGYASGTPSDTLRLPRSDEIFRGAAVPDHGPTARMLVFRLDP